MMGWQDQAACQDGDTRAWFPTDAQHDLRDQAIRVCQGCPVRNECLEHALATRPPGVWGATTERERARMIRERANA